MADERKFAFLDDMRRAELPPLPKKVADTLDEWLFRMHGIESGSHHVGAFLNFAADNGVTFRSVRPALTEGATE